MTVDVRPAQANDLDALVRLEADGMAADAWGRSVLSGELAAMPASRTVLVVDLPDEGVAAYGALRVVDATADVERVVVARSRRRRGLGRLLLQALLDDARARGCREVLLEVRVENLAAIALYEAVGFVEISRRRGYFAAQTDASVLRLALTQSDRAS